jgi:hypothetical protein
LFDDKPNSKDLDAISPAAGILLRQALVKLERARSILDKSANRPA